MKQEVKNTDDKRLDISIEEFDALDGNHTFSKEYQKQKRKMWNEYRKTVYAAKRKYAKIAVAASLLLVMLPVAVNAAGNDDFFNRIWGNSAKNMDPGRAEELIGKNISRQTVEEQLGDTKLTILSAVSDNQSAVVEFTLEKEGGVDALEYSWESNDDKGAAFSDHATFYFTFGNYDGCIYVDLERSTDAKLYCYDYMTYDSHSDTSELQLNLTQYPCTRKKMEGKDGYKYQKDVKEKIVSLPLKKVETVDFVNAGGGIVSISPISIKIDMAAGLGLSLEESYPDLNNLDPDDVYDASQDPGSIYYVAITDTKGERYIVEETETAKHACDVPVDNATYACGDEYSHITYTFNRLVDTDEIASITVNGTEYTRKSDTPKILTKP